MALRNAMPRLKFVAKKSLARLCAQVGREQALRECRWIMEATASNPLASSLESISTSLNLAGMLRRRVRGEPLQYILGTQPFGSLDLFVAPPTLIPRPETEEWAIWLAGTLRSTQSDKATPSRWPTLLDLCTGSGCIPLLLCSELPHGTIKALGVDISNAAINLARRNRSKHTNASSCGQEGNQFEVLQSDIFSSRFMNVLQDHPFYPFDVITSNPPYISRVQYEGLPPSVKPYEDPLALIGEAPVSHHPTGARIDAHYSTVNTKGLAFYRRTADLLESDESLIRPGGYIVLEVGIHQAPVVRELLSKALRDRLDFIRIRRDASGIERVVHAKLR